MHHGNLLSVLYLVGLLSIAFVLYSRLSDEQLRAAEALQEPREPNYMEIKKERETIYSTTTPTGLVRPYLVISHFDGDLTKPLNRETLRWHHEDGTEEKCAKWVDYKEEQSNEHSH